MEGNPMGVLPFMLGYPAITVAEGLFFTNLGYRLGTSALQRLFTGGMVARVIECSSMIGMMMMGALGSSYVSLSLANEAAQATLDGIVPGLLPLLLIFGVLYVLEHVTQKMQWLSLGILALGILTSFLGIF
jgi:mannose/fructose/N-acetylgalactosamine-specific phosphotransferase system component IID